MRGSNRRTGLVLGVITLAIGLVLPSAAWSTPASAAGQSVANSTADLLPDLEMAPIYGLTIKTNRKGLKRLRFGTRAFNIGAGPLEVHGRARDGKLMGDVVQRIYNGQGGRREVRPSNMTMFWAGDGHNHWHIERFINVELYKVGQLNKTKRIRKLGFCLLDLVKSSKPPANASPTRVYPYDACGKSVQVDSITKGISVGWADDYFPTTTYQWIDITTLPKGVYRLCAKVNPVGDWLESNRSNNFYWRDVYVDAQQSIVEVRRSGRSACGSYA
jgi:hypothetical protein